MPFAFIFLIALQDRDAGEPAAVLLAAATSRCWTTSQQVLAARDYLMVIAFINSFILTVVSVAALVILSAMVAYVWQRRRGRLGPVDQHPGAGRLIVPPAVVPTIWVLQKVGLFKTMPGLIFVEIAFGLPFCILLFRAFIASSRGNWTRPPSWTAPVRADLLPGDLPGAALGDHDGDHPAVGLHLQRLPEPAVLPARHQNATVQLTLFNFRASSPPSTTCCSRTSCLSRFPPLIMFIFFNRKIVEGMAAGSVKG